MPNGGFEMFRMSSGRGFDQLEAKEFLVQEFINKVQ